jgi:hypothetical protein
MTKIHALLPMSPEHTPFSSSRALIFSFIWFMFHICVMKETGHIVRRCGGICIVRLDSVTVGSVRSLWAMPR